MGIRIGVEVVAKRDGALCLESKPSRLGETSEIFRKRADNFQLNHAHFFRLKVGLTFWRRIFFFKF